MIEGLVGIAGGIMTILFARSVRGERWVYALGLLSLPGFYFAFAWSAGSMNIGLAELLWGLPFIVGGGIGLVLLSPPRTLLIIGSLWLAHGSFDLIHGKLIVNPGMPIWWPVFCAAFDAVVGLYLVHAAWRKQVG
jgi:hypothetical protein